MDEQVKYTEQDLERARYWVNWPSEHPSSVMAVRLEEVADLIHDVRAEAQQAVTVTVGKGAPAGTGPSEPQTMQWVSSARLAAAEKLGQAADALMPHMWEPKMKGESDYERALIAFHDAFVSWKEAAGK